ncbi:hypothetical protein E2F46_08560 [Luteimonas aestuarii]|uniref:Uncharacterized protein n=1 Tax=Luteimonas aestuarii TaxID=453837 RepID=A0A4R5TP00_9GAMM|nr:hypothetical protein [Luteimonas aestuarii]TDK24332.1 hypothetical protein E2F46_08560 [Luteimonas aestuarii]
MCALSGKARKAQVRCRRKSRPDIRLVAATPDLRWNSHRCVENSRRFHACFPLSVPGARTMRRRSATVPTKRTSGRDWAAVADRRPTPVLPWAMHQKMVFLLTEGKAPVAVQIRCHRRSRPDTRLLAVASGPGGQVIAGSAEERNDVVPAGALGILGLGEETKKTPALPGSG